MLRILALFAALIMTTTAHAAVKTERIEYTHDGVTLEGVLAYDDAMKPGEKRPGVLVCHEWWGNNDYSEGRAKQLAELGYIAFALDMYGKGKTTTSGDQAAKWAGEISADNAKYRERAAAGLKVLAENTRVDASRLAAIGYCMGGTVALELSRSGLPHTQNLKAVIPFHASTIAAKNPADNRNIKGTVMVCHGHKDEFVSPEQITQFHQQMSDAGIDYVFISYGAAVHAFTNPKADGSFSPMVKYNKEADQRSFAAMKDLLAKKFAK